MCLTASCDQLLLHEYNLRQKTMIEFTTLSVFADCLGLELSLMYLESQLGHSDMFVQRKEKIFRQSIHVFYYCEAVQDSMAALVLVLIL